MRNLQLHHWILLAMVLGLVVGLPLNFMGQSGSIDPAVPQDVAFYGKQLGSLFLRLLKMVVVPLIVCSLVSGVTGLGDLADLSRLGGRTLAFYMGTSLLAIATGIIVFNIVQPGRGADLSLLSSGADPTKLKVAQDDQSVGQILWDQLLHMVPTNPLAAAAEGDMLPIIFFSILLGVFINATGGGPATRLRSVFNDGFDVMMKMTMWVVSLAPFGVFGFMVSVSAGQGMEPFKNLAWYMLTVAIALCVHAFITLPILLRVLAGRPAGSFARAMEPALLTAFSTASSNATLPLTMKSVQDRGGVDPKTAAFVLPLGATINMDGTALYEAVAVLFIAQVSGVDLTLGQQVLVAFTALLASIGAAGIPHAGLVMMVVVLAAVGLPSDAVGLILAVDRVLDMCRTTVNVWSDSVCTAVIDRYVRTTANRPAPAD